MEEKMSSQGMLKKTLFVANWNYSNATLYFANCSLCVINMG